MVAHMRRGWFSRSLTGLAAGALLGAALLAVFALGSRFGLPNAAYSLFEWLTRVLPGRLVIFGLETTLHALEAVGLNIKDTSKATEEAIALTEVFVASARRRPALLPPHEAGRRRARPALGPGRRPRRRRPDGGRRPQGRRQRVAQHGSDRRPLGARRLRRLGLGARAALPGDQRAGRRAAGRASRQRRAGAAAPVRAAAPARPAGGGRPGGRGAGRRRAGDARGRGRAPRPPPLRHPHGRSGRDLRRARRRGRRHPERRGRSGGRAGHQGPDPLPQRGLAGQAGAGHPPRVHARRRALSRRHRPHSAEHRRLLVAAAHLRTRRPAVAAHHRPDQARLRGAPAVHHAGVHLQPGGRAAHRDHVVERPLVPRRPGRPRSRSRRRSTRTCSRRTGSTRSSR